MGEKFINFIEVGLYFYIILLIFNSIILIKMFLCANILPIYNKINNRRKKNICLFIINNNLIRACKQSNNQPNRTKFLQLYKIKFKI